MHNVLLHFNFGEYEETNMQMYVDKTKERTSLQEEWGKNSVTGEESSSFSPGTKSGEQWKRNSGGKSVKQHEISGKVNDKKIEADEKLNSGSFVFDMQVSLK